MKNIFVIAFFAACIGLSTTLNASPLTITATVKTVEIVNRPGIDWGSLRISVLEPITGTACAASDVSKGFFFTTGTDPRSYPVLQMMQAIAMASNAHNVKVLITYDTASTCYTGYGVGFKDIAILYN